METIKIRNATNSDKFSVISFCNNTFSWGDYIEYVWDFWLSEGNLFLVETELPVGMCHAFFSKNQVWIEGIRIHPNFRRHGLSSKLIKHVESLAKEKKISSSFMLIDVENFPSLLMAKNLDYEIFQTWNFYILLPHANDNYTVKFGDVLKSTNLHHFVKSWRWLPLDEDILFSLSQKNRILFADADDNLSIAILTDSEHFDKTLIVTLLSGSPNNTTNLISYIQNYGAENNYQKIQILTKEKLPIVNFLEHKMVFYLMQKFLD